MEINPSTSLQNSGQIIWVDDEQLGLQGHAVKSYRCTFCKRGFSNAQALGGHMNIHRKDRAKLKEFTSDQNLLSLNITTKNPTADDDDCPQENRLNASTFPGSREDDDDDHRSCSPEADHSIITSGKDGFTDLLKLPLFAETPSLRGGKEAQREVMKLYGTISESDEVDLELRLGPEPYDQELPTKP